ncbi:MAG: DNA repair protein RadA [Candidatus Omnitrophica bacterium CG12_big_fil_rev_8_21_14_0_65_43_15]|uniref:DNA repair protein RadA n=1 Tax=Candidatus Taenaricola geysiri TaxID=1974752 RepID=A0A2J0LDJ4_9BACT|nr:MAG: DNA repair protein RadA [Candidatus Omnitrophica bacterium CG1_02_43_210]PIW65931.1 MAG: DNA repair protein RadA [Candidatus Omnitrophica bacterium CG12_big_fil_rev_8_21_14_0_65_43_15]PIW79920.1 MAG: DNA repair protein RadA [Candidatus Omnitrophica bacterium CG_4_8_14_3_um_filter_43_15]PIY84551.1 MAG: DNA repair protein RadA [Candidatus Omnitrophica bacterium CG_4_10_14_0_8_um_filter_43_18]
MKTSTIYVCQSCGYQSSKWLGRCPECEKWNSLVEETDSPVLALSGEISLLNAVDADEAIRITTGIDEFDRILGGGIVPGSVTLIGGDPGIGKSTLLLQVCDRLSVSGKKVLYVSGEESAKQAKLRANRLGTASKELYILNQTNVELIKEHIDKLKPDILVVDSVQVVYSSQITSAPGSVSQVRHCAGFLNVVAKNNEIALFLIGHVTKDGSIAGPRVLEHLVDTVLYFEGDRFTSFRILRSIKNRFGSTNEIAIFEMLITGLSAVENPSLMLLSQRPKNISGSVVVASVEGTRPLLVEIQALTSPVNFGYPSRRSTGIDSNKMSLLIAVLEKRLGFNLSNFDVFTNVVGGLKITEPAVDLGVVAAIASSFKEKIVCPDCVVIGEVGLGAEVRRVNQIQIRVNEAEKLGFKKCVLPKANLKELKAGAKIELAGAGDIQEALGFILK